MQTAFHNQTVRKKRKCECLHHECKIGPLVKKRSRLHNVDRYRHLINIYRSIYSQKTQITIHRPQLAMGMGERTWQMEPNNGAGFLEPSVINLQEGVYD
jgi:hypothetical protein